MIEISSLSDEELAALLDVARLEYQRRRDLTSAIDSTPGLIEALLTTTGREPGAEWVQPLGAFDAYSEGWEVTHDGKTWVSLTAANVWVPGVSGWREITADGEAPPDWVQPSGAHDAYKTGDQVTHKGGVWTSAIDGSVWEPGVYGWTRTPTN